MVRTRHIWVLGGQIANSINGGYAYANNIGLRWFDVAVTRLQEEQNRAIACY